MDYLTFLHGLYLRIKIEITLTFSCINNRIELIIKSFKLTNNQKYSDKLTLIPRPSKNVKIKLRKNIGLSNYVGVMFRQNKQFLN